MIHAYREPLADLWRIDEADISKYIDIIQKRVVVYTVDFSKVEKVISSSPVVKQFEDFFLFTNTTNTTTTIIPLANLTLKYDQIKKLAREHDAKLVTIYTDIIFNNVVIRLNHDVRRFNIAFLDAVVSLNPIIIYFKDNTLNTLKRRRDVDKKLIDVSILVGEGIVDRNTSASCSVGFFARNAKAKYLTYIVTAGHCFANLSNLDHRPWNGKTSNILIGKVRPDKNTIAPYDYSLIRITNENINPSAAIRNTDSTQYKELFINSDVSASVSSIGAHLCKSGDITHITCGRIRAFDGYFVTINGTLKPLIITEISGAHGDSGAPAFSYSPDLQKVSLNGILSANAGEITYIVPLKVILNDARIVPVAI